MDVSLLRRVEPAEEAEPAYLIDATLRQSLLGPLGVEAPAPPPGGRRHRHRRREPALPGAPLAGVDAVRGVPRRPVPERARPRRRRAPRVARDGRRARADHRGSPGDGFRGALRGGSLDDPGDQSSAARSLVATHEGYLREVLERDRSSSVHAGPAARPARVELPGRRCPAVGPAPLRWGRRGERPLVATQRATDDGPARDGSRRDRSGLRLPPGPKAVPADLSHALADPTRLPGVLWRQMREGPAARVRQLGPGAAMVEVASDDATSAHSSTGSR